MAAENPDAYRYGKFSRRGPAQRSFRLSPALLPAIPCTVQIFSPCTSSSSPLSCLGHKQVKFGELSGSWSVPSLKGETKRRLRKKGQAQWQQGAATQWALRHFPPDIHDDSLFPS